MAQENADFAKVQDLAQAGRLNEAFELIMALAEQGDADALFTLADFYWQGGPVKQDPAHARTLFQRASNAGHPLGRMFFTNLLANGLFGSRDWRAAVKRFESESSLDPYRARAYCTLEDMDLDENGDSRFTLKARKLSDRLRFDLFPALFSAAECDLVIAAAEHRFLRSTIDDAQGREVPHPQRSSDGAPIHWLIEDPAIQALNRRLAKVSETAYDQAEPLLVLRYQRGQEYRRHLDALPGLRNQRVRTVLVYLNDDYTGGETEFPKLGIKLKARRGDVIVFDNARPDGAPEPISEHAGLPVISGVKFIGSRWIRRNRHLPD